MKSHLSSKLREAIVTNQESLYALAKRTGVPYSTIYRFVYNQRGITLETASSLCESLGLELTEIAPKRK